MIQLIALLNACAVAAAQPAPQPQIPLFRSFPSLARMLPRETILTGPTAVEPMTHLEERLFAEKGLKAPAAPLFWVKRDDISDSPLGGNKARKLEFLLADAAAQGAHTLVTSGMYGSNHALATAVAGHQRGLKVRLILGPQPVTPNVKKKLLALHALGAEMRYHGNRIGMGIDIVVQSLEPKLFPGRKLYYIPPGGSNSLGDVGYVNAFFELLDQVGPEGLPQRIVIPVGTMGTAAGVLVGTCLAGFYEHVKIEGVNVADPLLTNDGATRRQAAHLYKFIKKHLDDADRARLPKCDFGSKKAFEFVTAFYAPGYGATSADVFKGMRLLRETEKIVLDGTYSGKAMAYLLDSARRQIASGQAPQKTLFLLTYDAYDLDKIIETYPWTHPDEKWRDLPSEFQHLYKQ